MVATSADAEAVAALAARSALAASAAGPKLASSAPVSDTCAASICGKSDCITVRIACCRSRMRTHSASHASSVESVVLTFGVVCVWVSGWVGVEENALFHAEKLLFDAYRLVDGVNLRDERGERVVERREQSVAPLQRLGEYSGEEKFEKRMHVFFLTFSTGKAGVCIVTSSCSHACALGSDIRALRERGGRRNDGNEWGYRCSHKSFFSLRLHGRITSPVAIRMASNGSSAAVALEQILELEGTADETAVLLLLP